MNPDRAQQSVGRSALNAHDAIVLIPRAPLRAGAAYTVSITVAGATHTWSFSVASAGSTGFIAETDGAMDDGRTNVSVQLTD